MIQRGKKILIFPVETTVRELDFRLILGMLCARPDWQIIVGDHEQLFKLTLRLENAVAVLKNVTGGKRPWKYKRYKELNLRVINLDEEGAIYEEGPERWKVELAKRINVLELEANDHVCTWGQFQADYYRSLNPACAANIVATGHPRFDLCRPKFKAVYEEETQALRQKHGKFILINTNLLANNAAGPDVNIRLNHVKPDEVEKRSYHIEQFCYETHRQAHFVQLVNHLSNACPDHQIVFRPHPSENIHIYNTMFRHIPRVVVTREGSLHAWLQACQVLIHDGCTTAVEGYLSETPVINYHPITDARFDIVVPNLVGLSCKTPEEAVNAIHGLDAGRPFPGATPENLQQVTDLMLNFDPASDSFQLLTDVIHGCQDEAKETKVRGGAPMLAWHRLTDPLRQFAKSHNWLNKLLNRPDRGSVKFPPLDRRKLLQKVAIFEKITGTQVKITFHSSRIFSITPR